MSPSSTSIVVLAPGARAAAKFERVAKSLGHDQAAAGAVAFQHGIGGHGRAVDDQPDLAQCDSEGPQAVDQTLRQIGRRGQHLGHPDGARGLLPKYQDGIRAANVDAYYDGHGLIPGGNAIMPRAPKSCPMPFFHLWPYTGPPHRINRLPPRSNGWFRRARSG